MKITYIIPDINVKGGIQKFAFSVQDTMKNRYTFNNRDFVNGYPNIFILNILSRVEYVYDFLMLIRASYLNRILNDSDVIHSWHIKSALYLKKNKYIVTCHGLEILPFHMRGYIKKKYQHTLENAFGITADSSYTKKLLLDNFNIDADKIRIIYPSVDVSKMKNVRKVKNKKIILGTLSRLVKRKNVINIIKSLNILQEKTNLDFEYYLAGDGDQKELILNELKKAKFKWKYFGKITEKEKIQNFYPKLDIFVLPVLELHDSVEGFGIVYLEANAYGIPVVASAVGGVVDAVKEGISGVYAEPENPEDIAEKIISLIKSKKKYNKSTKEWIKKFDIKVIGKEFEDVYEECINY